MAEWAVGDGDHGDVPGRCGTAGGGDVDCDSSCGVELPGTVEWQLLLAGRHRRGHRLRPRPRHRRGEGGHDLPRRAVRRAPQLPATRHGERRGPHRRRCDAPAGCDRRTLGRGEPANHHGRGRKLHVRRGSWIVFADGQLPGAVHDGAGREDAGPDVRAEHDRRPDGALARSEGPSHGVGRRHGRRRDRERLLLRLRFRIEPVHHDGRRTRRQLPVPGTADAVVRLPVRERQRRAVRQSLERCLRNRLLLLPDVHRHVHGEHRSAGRRDRDGPGAGWISSPRFGGRRRGDALLRRWRRARNRHDRHRRLVPLCPRSGVPGPRVGLRRRMRTASRGRVARRRWWPVRRRAWTSPS